MSLADTTLQNATTALYKFLNKHGDVLYVGISNSVMSRFDDHIKCKSWVRDVTNIQVEWFDTRSEALLAEDKLICAGIGIHNQASNGSLKKSDLSDQLFRDYLTGAPMYESSNGSVFILDGLAIECFADQIGHHAKHVGRLLRFRLALLVKQGAVEKIKRRGIYRVIGTL